MFNSQEHADLRNTVARFVDQEINPHIDEWEAAKIFPARELFKKLGNLGLLGISKPEAYGGMGLDYSFSVAFAEELGRTHCGGIPMAIGVQTDMATPALARFGSDELCREFLAPAIAGDMVASIGVSEPGAGSDVAGLKTTARKDGGDYVINGTKMWITNGMQNNWICLLANTSDGAPHKNKSMIIVPMDTKGVERARKIEKIGMNGSDTAQIFFDEVRVPQRYLVGQEGMGFSMQMQQFQEERMFGAAMGLKGMELVVQATIDYTRERKAFGQSLLDNQVIHFRLAELQTEIEALRALVYRTAELYAENHDSPEVVKLASMCKLKVGRLAREVTDSSLQYWGGMGFSSESIVSRFYRDYRLTSIGGGADEVMLGIICKLMGTLPPKRKE
jgi:citronellyl-CoA dehydrogenase